MILQHALFKRTKESDYEPVILIETYDGHVTAFDVNGKSPLQCYDYVVTHRLMLELGHLFIDYTENKEE